MDNDLNKWLSNVTFNEGDVIYIERKKSNYIIQQEPKVNGAIIVVDPYSGDILALSGGYSFNKTTWICI